MMTITATLQLEQSLVVLAGPAGFAQTSMFK